MDESILTSIKKLLGISKEYTHFDADILMHINTVLFTLNQLGLPSYSIQDATAKWSDYLTSSTQLDSVKSYIYLKTRLLFDPPASSAALESMKALVSEYEWRINVAVDPEEKREEVDANVQTSVSG